QDLLDVFGSGVLLGFLRHLSCSLVHGSPVPIPPGNCDPASVGEVAVGAPWFLARCLEIPTMMSFRAWANSAAPAGHAWDMERRARSTSAPIFIIRFPPP